MGKSIAVFKTIENEKWSDNERIEALCAVADMPTLNSITKYEMQTALKWILNQTVVEVEDEVHHKRIDKIRRMSSEELAKLLVDISNCHFKDGCEGCWLAESNGCYRPYVLAEWLEEEVQEDARRNGIV